MRLSSLPVLALSLLLAACSGPSGQDAAAEAAAARAAREAKLAYEREVRDWRHERQERLLRPDGFLSLVGLHWLSPGATYVGSAQDNGTRLSLGPPQVGMLDVRKDGTVTLRVADGAEVTVDGEQVTPQPGSFYGGWITSREAGPFKGVPGSRFW